MCIRDRAGPVDDAMAWRRRRVAEWHGGYVADEEVEEERRKAASRHLRAR